METTLKFFIIALCVTKFIALLLCWRHGKRFVGSFWNKFRSGNDPLQIVRPAGVATAAESPVEPMKRAIYFCQFTLYRKVIQRVSQYDKQRNGAKPLGTNGSVEPASALIGRR